MVYGQARLGQGCARRATGLEQAHFAGSTHSTLKGLPMSINPDRPPKNFKDAMSRDDKQEWAEAFDKEYRGCGDS